MNALPTAAPISYQESREEQRAERAGITIAVITALLTALCLNFSPFQRFNDGDSFVPVLASLWRWTIFYWGENRFGWLVPLLAMPVRDPIANLIVQNTFETFCGLLGLMLLGRLLFGNRRGWVAGLASAAVVLYCFPPKMLFQYSVVQIYGVSLALGVTALLLLCEASSRKLNLTGLVLLELALWTNIGAIVLFFPLALWLGWSRRTRRHALPGVSIAGPIGAAIAMLLGEFLERRRELAPLGARLGLLSIPRPIRVPLFVIGLAGLTAISIVLLWMISRFCSRHLSNWWAAAAVVAASFVPALLLAAGVPSLIHETILPSSTWVLSFGRLATNSFDAFPDSSLIWVILTFFLGAAGVMLLQRTVAVPAMVALAVATIYMAVISTLGHVRLNHWDVRYAYPSVLLLIVALTGASIQPLVDHLRPRFLPLATAALLVAIAPFELYGPPSVAGMKAGLARAIPPFAADVVASSATFVMGNYWDVWPAVFAAAEEQYRGRIKRRVWGLAFRSHSTEKLWREALASGIIAVPDYRADRHDLARVCLDLRIQLTPAGHRGSVTLYRLQPGAR